MSRELGLSVLLAVERLLSAEKAGMACRDDSIMGLVFYPNRFLTNTWSIRYVLDRKLLANFLAFVNKNMKEWKEDCTKVSQPITVELTSTAIISY